MAAIIQASGIQRQLSGVQEPAWRGYAEIINAGGGKPGCPLGPYGLRIVTLVPIRRGNGQAPPLHIYDLRFAINMKTNWTLEAYGW
jgi:hypothetical protein